MKTSEEIRERLKNGGDWLGATRNWVQWKRRNGSQVTWGSNDVLLPHMTIKDVEEVALEAAIAAILGEEKHLLCTTRRPPDPEVIPAWMTAKPDYTGAWETAKYCEDCKHGGGAFWGHMFLCPECGSSRTQTTARRWVSNKWYFAKPSTWFNGRWEYKIKGIKE
jgi:hypothetical protein